MAAARTVCRGARSLCAAAESAPAGGGRKRAFRRWIKAYDAQADALAAEHDAAASTAGLPWRVVAATFVERTPIILRDAEDWEQAWWDVEDEVAVPDVQTPNGFWAKQSECVLRPPPRSMARVLCARRALPDPPCRRPLLRRGAHVSTSTPPALAHVTPRRRYEFVREVVEMQRAARADGSSEAASAADDAIDAAADKGGFDLAFLDDQLREAEWEADFVPAPRATPADEANDTTSLDRKLSESLYLVVPSDGALQLPSAAHVASDAHLRGTVDRSLAELFGKEESVEVFVGSNAPLGHWLRPFSPEEQQASGVYGEKVFLYNARYVSGADQLAAGAQWLSREELSETLAADEGGDFPAFVADHVLGGSTRDLDGIDA